MSHAARTAPSRALGFIVNPLAGLGGAVALRGSDGLAAEALRRGAEAAAPARAARALARLDPPPGAVLLAAGGAMGEAVARAAGLDVVAVTRPGAATTAADTMAAAAAMRAAGVELILFAGGDGTARDIAAIVGTDIPLIGVPSGVKMHSAVFAATPESAGLLARDVLRAAPGAIPAREAEILDVDETARRAGVPRARLYGLALVPAPRRPMPHAKLSGSAPGAALRAACVDVARGLRPDRLYLIGPGTTTRLVMRALGLPDTLLGIDAVRDGQLIGADLTRADIARMAADGPLGVIVGVIGGQGVLFGRGNQQIAPDILRRAGRDGIIVLADADKIAALDGGALFVDTGDPDLDAAWRGYIRVRTAPDRSLLCRVLS